MKTLNTAAAFINTTVHKIDTQTYFNGMIEGLTATEILVGSYYNSLSTIGKELFTKMFTGATDEAVVTKVAKVVKYRSIKLRRQLSTVAKRRVKKVFKAKRAKIGLFSLDLFKVMEGKADMLLRRVGIRPTEKPILELMSIPTSEAAFLFKSEELFSELKVVIKLAAKLLSA